MGRGRRDKVRLSQEQRQKLTSQYHWGYSEMISARWQQERNPTASQVIWHFTTQDARVKLKHLYPAFEQLDTVHSNATN